MAHAFNPSILQVKRGELYKTSQGYTEDMPQEMKGRKGGREKKVEKEGEQKRWREGGKEEFRERGKEREKEVEEVQGQFIGEKAAQQTGCRFQQLPRRGLQ